MQPTENPIRILHLEDDDNDHLLVSEMLHENGFVCNLTLAQSKEQFSQAIERGEYDLVISDFTIPSYNGLNALTLVRKIQPNMPFIFFSGSIGEDFAVESLTNGATDYVLKQRPKRLVAAIRRALQNAAAQRHLQHAQEKILEQASLLDKASDAILVCDMKRRVVFWNKSAERIYGWRSDEVMRQNIIDILFQKNPSHFDEATMNLAQRGEWTGEMEHQTKNGENVLVQSRFTLIRDDAENPKSHLIVNTDITEIKKMETRILRTERLESLGTLVSSIAHDLNNTLTPIYMGLSLLRMKMVDPDLNDILKTMENSVTRGTDMVKQVLTFARGGEMQKGAVSVDLLLEEMSKIIANTFPKNIQCHIQKQECKPIFASSTQIHQVLLNLCVNARDAMPEGGCLTISARKYLLTEEEVPGTSAQPGEYICIGVMDTGMGIPEDRIKKIFEPFFTTKVPGKGTGLGLSTSIKIIKNHNGFMRIDSKVGEGSEFRFYLPTFSPTPGKIEKIIASPHLPEGKGEYILIIHDGAGISAMVKSTLDNYNYHVFTAENVTEGMMYLKENRDLIQLVIISLSTALLNNPNTIDSWKNIVPEIKIIALTKFEEDHHPSLPPIQVDNFIHKPFTSEKLLFTVHQVLEDKNQSP